MPTKPSQNSGSFENMELNLSDIKKNQSQIDSEDIHLRLKEEVESGKYKTYLEALTAFVTEQNIDLNDIAMESYITPSLRGIIYNEARRANMLVEKPLKHEIADFF